MEEIVLMRGMNEMQVLMFQSEMGRRRKSVGVAFVLALLLGNVGGHRFYLGQVGLGVVYLLFSLTFIPAVITLFELFVLSGRVRDYNAKQAQDVAMQIRALASAA